MALTPKQMNLHDFLSRFHQKHGYAPTIAEIQEHFQLSSPATVPELVGQRAELGVVFPW